MLEKQISINNRMIGIVSKQDSARVVVAMALTVLCSLTLAAQDGLGRRALDHGDYEKWKSIGQTIREFQRSFRGGSGDDDKDKETD